MNHTLDLYPGDNQHIYLVMPIGYEERTTIVIAKGKVDAQSIALTLPDISEAVRFGSQLRLLDATEVFGKQGWEIFVARKGDFH